MEFDENMNLVEWIPIELDIAWIDIEIMDWQRASHLKWGIVETVINRWLLLESDPWIYIKDCGFSHGRVWIKYYLSDWMDGEPSDN